MYHVIVRIDMAKLLNLICFSDRFFFYLTSSVDLGEMLSHAALQLELYCLSKYLLKGYNPSNRTLYSVLLLREYSVRRHLVLSIQQL